MLFVACTWTRVNSQHAWELIMTGGSCWSVSSGLGAASFVQSRGWGQPFPSSLLKRAPATFHSGGPRPNWLAHIRWGEIWRVPWMEWQAWRDWHRETQVTQAFKFLQGAWWQSGRKAWNWGWKRSPGRGCDALNFRQLKPKNPKTGDARRLKLQSPYIASVLLRCKTWRWANVWGGAFIFSFSLLVCRWSPKRMIHCEKCRRRVRWQIPTTKRRRRKTKRSEKRRKKERRQKRKRKKSGSWRGRACRWAPGKHTEVYCCHACYAPRQN